MVRRCVVVVLALAAFPGCGIGLQTALGWSSEETVQRTARKQVQIETRPANAEVTRRDGRAGEVVLGSSPLVDTIEYQVEEKTRSPDALGLLIGGAAELAAGTAGWMLGRGEERCFADGECFRTEEPKNTLLGISGTLIVLGAIDLLVAASHGFDEDQVESKPIDPPAYAYLARKDGFREAGANVEILKSSSVVLALEPISVPPPVVQQPARREPDVRPPAKSWVIAVMDLELSESRVTELAIDPTLVKSVAEQVRVFVAGRGYRTVDAGASRALLDRTLRIEVRAQRRAGRSDL